MSWNVALDTTQSLNLKLAGAVAADQPEFSIGYIDTTGDTPGCSSGETNSTTEVVGVAAPAADNRIVYRIDICNIDTATITVILILKDSDGTDRTILRRELTTGKSANLLENETTSSAANHAANHTDGTDDIQSATNAQKGLATAAHITAIEANTGKTTNADHTGEVTGDAALTITNKAVTLAKMNDMATASLLGRNTAAVGVPEVLSKATALSLLGVADGADVTGSNAPQAHKDSHDPNDGGDALDTAAAAEVSVVVGAGAGTSHSLARADHIHAINHGITDNHIVTIDDADAAANDFMRLTVNGLEGRSYAEVMGDLSGQAAADFAINTHKITGVVDPTANQDAATKKYVDDNSGGTYDAALGDSLLAFRFATSSIFMEHGWIDNFVDETMVDGAASLNEEYNAVGDYYNPVTSGGTDIATGGTPSASSGTAANAFDDDNGTLWEPASIPEWLKYDLGSGNDQACQNYTIRANGAHTNYVPTAWTFQGSNNDSDWTTLDTQSGVTSWTVGEKKSYVFSNGISYRYYKLNVTASVGAAIQIAEVEFYPTAGTVNVTLISESVEAESNDPDNADIIVRFENVDAVTVGTDLKGHITMDNGSNWEELTTVEEIATGDAHRVYKLSKTGLTARTDSTMLWKLTTHNNKDLKIHNISVMWEYA